MLRSPTYYLVRSLPAGSPTSPSTALHGAASSQQPICDRTPASKPCWRTCLAMGALVPFLYPHPYIFIGVEQLAANLLADSLVETYLGNVQPS